MLLKIKDLSKSYKQVHALKNISLEVKQGEIVALLGSNGAGKTTLMSIASGLRSADSGEIQINGMSPMSLSAKKIRRTLPQELSFPLHLKVKEILDLVYSHYESSQFEELAALVDMSSLLGRYSSELSGGERRKLALLCALAGEPELVLLDEPTANIDLVGQEAIRRLLLSYFKSKNNSLLFSSHQMQEVEALADRVVVMSAGEIVFEGPIEKIKAYIGLKKVRAKLSVPQMTLDSATGLQIHGSYIEAIGPDSDQMLKELIAKDKNLVEIEVSLPSLEEAILKIWDDKKNVI